MPRNLSPAMVSALEASVLRPALFVQITFNTGPINFWSGLGTFLWNSLSWAGTGSLGSISTIEEGTDIQARGITLILSGIDNSLLAGCLQELSQELPVIIWLGLFDSSGNLISDPSIIWSGQTDQPQITFGPTTGTIQLNCESRLLEMNVPASKRYTADQATLDCIGDTAFAFVASIQEQSISWGQAPTTATNI